MARVVVLGRGASGKSVFSAELARELGVPVIELDEVFWSDELVALPPSAWAATQERLAADEHWVMDGDLGPYDVIEPRLRRAEAVVLFRLPLRVCAYRAVRRSRARLDFWLWMLSWRRRFLPGLERTIAIEAPRAHVVTVRRRRDTTLAIEQLQQLFGSSSP